MLDFSLFPCILFMRLFYKPGNKYEETLYISSSLRLFDIN